MKTIQEHLKTQDKEAVIDAYLYRYMSDRYLQEHPDMTYEEAGRHCADKIDKLIDRLISLDPLPNENNLIFLATHCFPGEREEDIDFALLREDELGDDWSCRYSIEFTPFEEAVSCYVADTYLTQYWIDDLLAYFLHEITWTGYEQEHLEEVTAEINEAIKEVDEHKDDLQYFATHEEFIEQMEEAFGFEFEKRDPDQEKAFKEVMKHVCKYNETCQKIEKRKLMKLIDEERKQEA